ncbi:MAG: response regulator [Verrucomicrobia bacterium]|nr:response regulator [Verrucomicrobiota bacterium]MBU1735781.1 response regulator [Verrucomicrobiota bacterium]MBU1855563.1 response regulator [Verrucomicrobiota bacterium]
MDHNEQLDQTVRITLLPAEALEAAKPAKRPKLTSKTAGRPRETVRAKLGASEFMLYREFLQNIYDAVLITDWEGHLLDGNTRSTEFLRYEVRELREKTIFDIIYGFDEAILQKICDNLDRDQFTLIEEAYCRRKDQSLFPTEIATNKLHLGDEKHICFFVRDITRRKQDEKILRQTRDQLARAERLEMAGSIAGHIAHDFNNLLTPLVAYPEFIRAKLPENSPAHADLDVIAKTAQQMAHINQQLLALSRRAYHEQSVLNINAVIETEVLFLERNESAKGIKLDLALAGDLFNMKGSPQQLLRVIQNLCQNAIEAMGPAGTLTIKTNNVCLNTPVKKYELMTPGEYIKVSIADTGHGIPPEIQDKLFDPFFTTRKADKQRGSGLGLSVVRGIVKDHQGFIDLESTIGVGSTFSLYLPACRDKIQPVEPEKHYTGTETILVVDDDKLQIEVMTRLLQAMGYTVENAHSGEEALRLFAQRKEKGHFPQLVVLDMVMSEGMDGARIYQELKAINPKQRGIIVSGYAESPRVTLAQTLGIGAYLRKPVTLEKLSKAVRQELDRTTQ